MKLTALLLLSSAAMAQQPRLENARLETRAAGSSLESTFRAIVNSQADPAWIGYAVPVIAGERSMCCWSSNSCCNGCALEGRQGVVNTQPDPGRPVPLEGAKYFFVFYRVEQRNVDKVRTFSADCAVDAGGLPFFFLTGVNAAQSVALLEPLVAQSEKRQDSVVGAIALHNDLAADQALERLVAAAQPENVRRSAAFWLGNSRGRRGYEVLARLVREDQSDRVREHAVFALTQNKEPEAIPAVVRVAQEDKSPRVRGQALFWLAQRATRQISESAIRDAIEKDAETEVKKKAVFALTQIPHGEGVPMLIEVAKGNRNAAVRKQAMFWLGQSKDSRAVRFFEEVLAAK